MKLFTRTLDIVITPAENFFYFMQDIGWLIALGALLAIGAAVGIILFARKKKEDKK